MNLKILRTLMVTLTVLLTVGNIAAAQTTEPPSAVITLARSGCFGACPTYNLTIYDDGLVVYEGINHVEQMGKHTINLGEEAVADLVDGMVASGYLDFEDEYSAYRVTDMPTVITSLTVDGETKTVEHYLGDDSAPVALGYIETWIDESVYVMQWTGRANETFGIYWNAVPVFTLERLPCFGFCPVYRLVIYDDGTVVYVGNRFVEELGVRTDMIEVDVIEETLTEFEDAGYFDWQEEYMEQTATDGPITISSAWQPTRSRTIQHYHFDENAPEALTTLENRIDEIADSARWIGEYEG